MPSTILGGKLPVFVFVLMLLSFVTESELTQYVQTNLNYRKPFLIFYVVHSSFLVPFPLHCLFLYAKTGRIRPYLQGLHATVTQQLDPTGDGEFPLKKFLILVASLTLGVTVPGLLWFSAISLASISDVSSIWNMNALFAYAFTVSKFEPRRLTSVCIASLGTLVVIYGSTSPSRVVEKRSPSNKPKNPLLGDLLTLVASVGYALYQVLYKKYAALPSDPEVVSEHLYEPLAPSENVEEPSSETTQGLEQSVYPLPFAFHANLISSTIGLCTLVSLWILFPILHHYDIETFALPPDMKTASAIALVATSGLLFNASLMILLGIWGPVVVSAGNLLSIVLVFFADILWGAGIEAVTFWSVVGSSMIVVGFSILVYDMFYHR